MIYASLILSFTILFQSLTANTSQQTIGGYYENWSQYRPGVQGRPPFTPSMIDATLLTDIYYAFGFFGFVSGSIDPNHPHLTGDYSIQPVEWNDQSTLYPEIMALKNSNPDLRVLLSIGGWSFNDPNNPTIGQYTYRLFSQMVADAESRKNFIDSAINYAHQFGFDGIDLDWEYPGDTTRGGNPSDFDNFLIFLGECHEAFQNAKPALLLTYASPAAIPTGVPPEYHNDPALFYRWLAKCSAHLDRLNVMCYDYHGPFDSTQLTGVNAPLDRDTDPASTLFVTATLDNYINNGVPPTKIVLGIPTYGHSFGNVSLSSSQNGPGLPFSGPGTAGPSTREAGFLSYFEIADMTTLKQLVFGTDKPTTTAYGYNLTSRQWVSFDTPDTTAWKVNLAQSYGLQGVMFWAIDLDEYCWKPTFPNIRKAHDMIRSFECR